MEELFNRSKSCMNRSNTATEFNSVKLKSPEMELLADENLISQVLVNLIKMPFRPMRKPQRHDPTCCRIEFRPSSRNKVDGQRPRDTCRNTRSDFCAFFTTRENGSGIGLSRGKSCNFTVEAFRYIQLPAKRLFLVYSLPDFDLSSGNLFFMKKSANFVNP